MSLDDYIIDEPLDNNLIKILGSGKHGKPLEIHPEDVMKVLALEVKKIGYFEERKKEDGKAEYCVDEGVATGVFTAKNLYETIGDKGTKYIEAIQYYITYRLKSRKAANALDIKFSDKFRERYKNRLGEVAERFKGSENSEFYKGMLCGLNIGKKIFNELETDSSTNLSHALAFFVDMLTSSRYSERLRKGLKFTAKLIFDKPSIEDLLAMSEEELFPLFEEAFDNAIRKPMPTFIDGKPVEIEFSNDINKEVSGIYIAKFPKEAQKVFDKHNVRFFPFDEGLGRIQSHILKYRTMFAKTIFGKYLKKRENLNTVLNMGKLISNMHLGFGRIEDLDKLAETDTLHKLLACTMVDCPYQVRDFLGEGSQGMVFQVYSPEIDQARALKLVGLESYQEEEARIMGILEANPHPNFPKIFDAGKHIATFNTKPAYAILMEYIEGEPIIKKVGDKKAFELGAHISNAMHHLYRLGIKHRDLNKNNILITKDGIIKIIDFGISTTDTSAEPKDNRRYGGTDLMSLGQIVYSLATGKNLFNITGNKTELVADQVSDFRKKALEDPELMHKVLFRVWETVEYNYTKTIIKDCLERDSEWVFKQYAQLYKLHTEPDYD